jgi:hypothetical protein
VLKSSGHLLRGKLDRLLEKRRLAGFNLASKTLAKHADRAKSHRPRNLVTATRAVALVLVAHGLNRKIGPSGADD